MIKKVAIYGKSVNEDFFYYFSNLVKKLENNNIDILCYKPLLEGILNTYNYQFKTLGTFTSYYDIDSGIDLMFSIGGDGTFLETLQIIIDKNIPVLGINSGRLGFLATISKEEIQKAIEKLIEGKFCTEQRSILQLVSGIDNGSFKFALNDITIQKKDSTLITIHTYLNDDFLNSYWSDGLIIATPTGSTAYSLSVGGPIVIPYSKNFIISPIAPHNLSVRPIVVPDNFKISLFIESRSSKFTITLDHRVEECCFSEPIIIKKAPFYMNIIKLDYVSFYETLRNKLMWGIDKRN